MALKIASVPVLEGKASDRFNRLMKESENKRGKVDFTNQIAIARRILLKAKL